MADNDVRDGRGTGDPSSDRPDRRRFLGQLCAGAMAAAGSQVALPETHAAPGDPKPTSGARGKLPTIRIGDFRMSRLIVGSNPISGYSHSTHNLAEHMLEYFTLERTIEFIQRCERFGINTWQSGHGARTKVTEALAALRERGSKIQWFCLAADRPGQSVGDVLVHKPIAIVHHGGVTDRLFREGQGEKVHDFVKKTHDAGVMAGVSAHNPANIAYMEEKGWENEFFMTCLYHVSRPAEEIRKKLGTVQVGEPFFESDRDEMTEVVRQVARPCLAFKLLAAGRLCWNRESVESAFAYAFSRIKETDGVIVGMYPKFSDEIAHNVQLTRKYGVPA